MNIELIGDAELTALASNAFDLGLRHGRVPGIPATSEWVCVHLGIPHSPLIYVASLNATYRAGYDIGAMQRRFKEAQDRL